MLVVGKSTDHDKFDLFFLPQYQRQRNLKRFSLERELKKALRDTLTRATWYGL